MTKYIEAEEAKQCIRMLAGNNTSKVCDGIDKLTPADVRENTHGYWIDTGSGQECSVCHEIQYGYDTFRYFCACCGADMREKRPSLFPAYSSKQKQEEKIYECNFARF